MKHGHARQCAKAARKQRIDSANPKNLKPKQIPLDVHLVYGRLIFLLWCQVYVFFDVEELPSDDLLDEALDLGDVKLGIELAHFAFDDVQGVSAQVGVIADVGGEQALDFHLTAGLARARPSYTVLGIIVLIIVQTLVLAKLVSLADPQTVLKRILGAPGLIITEFKITMLIQLLHRAAIIINQRQSTLIRSVSIVHAPQALIPTTSHTLRIVPEIKSKRNKANGWVRAKF